MHFKSMRGFLLSTSLLRLGVLITLGNKKVIIAYLIGAIAYQMWYFCGG